MLFHCLTENGVDWTVDLLSPCRQQRIKLNLLGEEPTGPDKSD